MAQRPGIAFSHDFAARGRALAEQRLAYLTELYDSGRWKRFHGDADFLSNVREARAAVDAWRRLEQPEPERLEPGQLEHIAPAPPQVSSAAPDTAVAFVSPEPVQVDEAGGAILLLQHVIGQDNSIDRENAAEPDWHLGWGSRLPPIRFSTDDVGAERNLREA